MKLSFAPCVALALTSLPLVSAANQALAQRKNCMSCHAVGARVVGPSFKEIAAKYAAQDDAATGIAGRIVKGSSGRWGVMPMPANPQVTAVEAQALAKWILELK